MDEGDITYRWGNAWGEEDEGPTASEQGGDETAVLGNWLPEQVSLSSIHTGDMWTHYFMKHTHATLIMASHQPPPSIHPYVGH